LTDAAQRANVRSLMSLTFKNVGRETHGEVNGGTKYKFQVLGQGHLYLGIPICLAERNDGRTDSRRVPE